jgi:hypothetical protein
VTLIAPWERRGARPLVAALIFVGFLVAPSDPDVLTLGVFAFAEGASAWTAAR